MAEWRWRGLIVTTLTASARSSSGSASLTAARPARGVPGDHHPLAEAGPGTDVGDHQRRTATAEDDLLGQIARPGERIVRIDRPRSPDRHSGRGSPARSRSRCRAPGRAGSRTRSICSPATAAKRASAASARAHLLLQGGHQVARQIAVREARRRGLGDGVDAGQWASRPAARLTAASTRPAQALVSSTWTSRSRQAIPSFAHGPAPPGSRRRASRPSRCCGINARSRGYGASSGRDTIAGLASRAATAIQTPSVRRIAGARGMFASRLRDGPGHDVARSFARAPGGALASCSRRCCCSRSPVALRWSLASPIRRR